MKNRSRFLKTIQSLLAVTVAVQLMATSVVAQEQMIRGAAIPIPQGRGMAAGAELPSKEKLGGAKQFQMMCFYTMEIRRVEAAAKLDAAQKTKLTVGAKGLAKKKSQQLVKAISEFGFGGGAGNAPAAKPAGDEPELKFVEVKSADDIDEGAYGMLEGIGAEKLKPFDDPEWLKLVKSVLSAEQFAQYEQAIAANKVKTDKATVEVEMAVISRELALSQDQSSKLSALVLEQMSKAKSNPDLTQVRMLLQLEGLRVKLELSKLDPAKLRAILAPQQWEQLSLKLDSVKESVNAMNPEVMGGPIQIAK